MRRKADDSNEQWLGTPAKHFALLLSEGNGRPLISNLYPKPYVMSKERNSSYSADHSASPRECQHSSATREGHSVGVRSCRDDDTSVSEAGSERYRCRESFLMGKKKNSKRNKKKIRKKRHKYWNLEYANHVR